MTNEEAIKVLRTIIDNSVEMTIREWEEFDKKVLKAVDMAIEALQDRPTGRWVRSGNTLICPICGAKGEDIKDDYCFNYCPNCGTYMRNNK